MWQSLQTIGKARVPRQLHEGRPMRLNFSLILQQSQITGHAEDEHMCSALVHMCGEVRFHLVVARRFYYLSLFFSRAPSKTYNYPAGKHSRARKAVLFLGMFRLQLHSPSNLTKLLTPQRPRARFPFLLYRPLPSDVRALQTTMSPTAPSRAYLWCEALVWVSILYTYPPLGKR